MRSSVRTPILGALTALALTVPIHAAATAATTSTTDRQPSTAGEKTTQKTSDDGFPTGRKAQLEKYVADTWHSFEAMVDPATGLPTDNIGGDLTAASRAGYTSPTNIGAYLWSTVVARDTGLITADEARERMSQTLETVEGLQRHEPSGQFYNWYDPATGDRVDVWPDDGNEVKHFLSSVDNGWLATGLLVTEEAVPALAEEAHDLRTSMDFGCYYNPAENQIRGGFWDEDPDNDAAVLDDYCDMGTDVYYTGHHYGALNTEPRMASYLGIAAGQIPARHYWGMYRTFPSDTCDWSWTETKPVGEWKTYDGERVFEGALPYRGMDIVPTWGGSMFEALMVPLFVPEDEWGPQSWGVNHPLYVQGQMEHGLDEAGYGYWGFSPSNNPAGGYREYGVDQLGLDGPGYTSDQERTDVDQPFEGCREGSEAPTEYGDGVVTPHASFLALRYKPGAALANLRKIRTDFDAYGAGGFYDAIATQSGQVSHEYLSLDQGMIMAALGNALTGDDLRHDVATDEMRSALKPLMAQEVFASAPRED
ncbi:glucoamylase family protein [Nocardioides bruguierae]|uniref:DUF3131 domain-containing protein n=1 Tax=Nocardioides bruguierae TaxID=2945102 RepID=A0A9X2D6M9_9ACTN|nr:glucoamylase family protein [Nocardioides bruguierae]MCM0620148.1 DUF3131 domain-containing protein [Nocardioides bruguierae]